METSLSIYWNHDVLFLENTIRVRSWAAEATGPALVGIFLHFATVNSAQCLVRNKVFILQILQWNCTGRSWLYEAVENTLTCDATVQ